MGRPLVSNAQSSLGATKTTPLKFDPTALRPHLYGGPSAEYVRVYESVLNLLAEDVFRPRYGETVTMERSRTRARLARLFEAGYLKGLVGGDEVAAIRRYDAVVAAVALLDHSLEVYMGVSFGLFGSTVARLGSASQSARWLPPLFAGREFGCFALTELGHGSNVRGIRTTAHYNHTRGGFILRTPDDDAQKFWIGGAAQSATVSVVFARLFVSGEFKGIHVFVVRLRDHDGNVQPGITLADCGVKAGLNGVDNGRIWFSDVFVPRTDMLSGSARVDENGSYVSEYSSPDSLFAATLAALTGGRVGIAYAAVMAAAQGLTIAVRYCTTRRAFAPAPGMPETPLLTYTSQQRRLCVPLAACVVYLPAAQQLREMWYGSRDGAVSRAVHVLSAGLKAVFSSFMRDALQAAREACGGQGYALHNRIALVRADRDVMLTFEGANDVLLQQVGKGLLAERQRAGKRAAGTRPGRNQLLDVLRAREEALIEQLAARFTAEERQGRFQAWNACLNVAERASRAHIARLLYEMHLKHCTSVAGVDASSGAVLKLCGELWVRFELDSDADTLRTGVVDVAWARDNSARIDVLCGEVARIANLLVDAFGIPDHLLAPIAGDWLAYYARAKL